MAWRRLTIALVAVALVASSCGEGRPPSSSATANPAAAVSAGSHDSLGVRFERAFPALPRVQRPTALVEVPGQNWMLLQVQDGRILGFARDASARSYTTVWDNRARTSRDGNEEGLLGLALDPAFATNGFIYVYYSASGGERRTVLSRLSTSGSAASLKVVSGSELQILEQPQPYSNHKGGQLAFGPDGMLYLGFGDGGSGGDPMGNGQDITRNWLGSIIRIDVRNATSDRPYAVPASNPFSSGASAAKPETWAYGLRNPWRFSFDSKTGEMWIGDVGESQWEEVDRGQPGANYGWAVMEGSHCFQPPSGCDRAGLTLPAIDYGHAGGACSITGGFVYRGTRIAALDGYYLYADYCTGIVQAFPVSSAVSGGHVKLTTLRKSGLQVTSFAQDIEGELYLLDSDGTIETLVAS